MEITLHSLGTEDAFVTNQRRRPVKLQRYEVRQDGAPVGVISQHVHTSTISIKRSTESVRWAIESYRTADGAVHTLVPSRTSIEARYGVLHKLFGQYLQVAFGAELDAALNHTRVVKDQA
jgi:hypothetical protein